MKNYWLILLIFVYIHAEVVHIQFSEHKYAKNFFAPKAKAFNSILPSFLSFLEMPEVDQEEWIWWYARNLVIYVKALILSIIAYVAYRIKEHDKFIDLMFVVLIFFIAKEIRDYIFFKNIFNMYNDNLIATGAIVALTGLYIYKGGPERN